jgi:hypothetical protein
MNRSIFTWCILLESLCLYLDHLLHFHGPVIFQSYQVNTGSQMADINGGECSGFSTRYVD